MRPFLFQIGSFGVPAFFFTIMVGSLAGSFYAARVARKQHLDPVVMLDFGILGIIASVIGSRLFHVFIEQPRYYWEDPIRIFYFWQGGFVSIGAFVFTIIAWLIYLRVRHLERLRYLDVITLAVPIIIFCVRLGCLLAGCCFGKPTDFFIHLTFTNPMSYAGKLHPGEPLHAVQLYFMLNAIVMFFVLHFVYRRRKFVGQVLATFLLSYGVTRFLLEYLRGDDDRGVYFDATISTGQIAMILSFFMGATLWWRQHKKKPA